MTAPVDPQTLSVFDHFDGEREDTLSVFVREIIGQSFSPPPKLTVSEWADERRVLSSEGSSEPGKWKTSRVEPSRGVMDAFSDPETEQISCMVAAQTFKTEALLNILGFHVDLDPCPTLILQPTLQMAEAFSKDRLAPMARDTPAVGVKIGVNSRDSEDTILHKKYAGGHITLAGANSPASLASRPIRVLLCDEVDRYEASAGKEGDPVSLAIERTTTFWNRKIALFSTPTIKGVSRIEAAYEESDQRRYFVDCPACGHSQYFRWRSTIVRDPMTGRETKIGGVRWPEGQPLGARYHCEWNDGETGEVCDYGWSEAERLEAIQGGRWIATRPEVKGHAGFHLNRMASPWRALGEMARDFALAKKHPERLKTWVNTRLAETWEERGERADTGALVDRVEEYGDGTLTNPIPSGVGTVTAGVDIQDDRFEIEWVGWGVEDESWSLDYHVHYGDPNSAAFWEAVDAALYRRFRHPSGYDLNVEATCIDSGGHFTQQVYAFTRQRMARKVYAIKGRGGPGHPLWPPKGTKNAAKQVTVFLLGVDQGKDTIMKRLGLKEPGPGYCHFPKRSSDTHYPYTKQHFDGLTAEKAVLKTDRRGFTVKEWVKDRVRNEPLDCRVYAYAARLSLGINMERRLSAFRQALATALNRAPQPASAIAPAATVEHHVQPPIIPRTQGRRMRSRGVEA